MSPLHAGTERPYLARSPSCWTWCWRCAGARATCARIPGMNVAVPHSTFYLFPDVTEAMDRMGYTAVGDFAAVALHQTGVSFCTREHFGRRQSGEERHYIRLAYSGIEVADIREGLGRLERVDQRRMSRIVVTGRDTLYPRPAPAEVHNAVCVRRHRHGRRIEVGHRQSVHCPAIAPMRQVHSGNPTRHVDEQQARRTQSSTRQSPSYRCPGSCALATRTVGRGLISECPRRRTSRRPTPKPTWLLNHWTSPNSITLIDFGIASMSKSWTIVIVGRCGRDGVPMCSPESRYEAPDRL